jgi:hypothetical protein
VLVDLGLLWTLWLLVLLSIFPDKKVNYALPLFPGLAWMAGAGLCRLPWDWLRRWYARGLRGLAPAAVVVAIALHLAPVQFQAGADPDWAALISWLQREQVQPGTVCQQGLDRNSVSYYYLKTGEFPRRHLGPGCPGADVPHLLLLWKPKEPTQQVLFTSGPLRVVTVAATP